MQLLPDREIKKLLGVVIKGSSESYLNPNGLELRLGSSVRFHSTKEEFEVEDGAHIKVNPGESISICSHELIDFSRDTVDAIYPGKQLVGLITPTTTMMREGISQITTKIDSGYRGYLNWSLRNSSYNDLYIERGEPIYKLSLLLLDEGEVPDDLYGERDNDQYQDTAGIQISCRKISADMKSVVESSERVDPERHLEEAGFPFNHIAREFTGLKEQITMFRASVQAGVVQAGAALLGLGATAFGITGFMREFGLTENIISATWLGIGVVSLVLFSRLFSDFSKPD